MPTTNTTTNRNSSRNNTENVSTSNVLMTYANDFAGFLFLPFTIIWSLITSLIGIGSRSTSSTTDNTPSTFNRQSSQINQPVNDNIRFLN